MLMIISHNWPKQFVHKLITCAESAAPAAAALSSVYMEMSWVAKKHIKDIKIYSKHEYLSVPVGGQLVCTQQCKMAGPEKQQMKS